MRNSNRKGLIILGATPVLAGVLLVMAFLAVTGAWASPTGKIVVAGYGPELPIMQDLAKAFEKANPGTAVDLDWDKNVKAVERVKSGEAQVAVTDQEVSDLMVTPIGWDGIAVIVNFTNPVAEITSNDVKRLFTGKIRRWTELNGADTSVIVVDRTAYDNVKLGFEESLGIVGQVQGAGKPLRTDQRALREVSGKDSAVSYLSLPSALKAQEDGIPIRVLNIDGVEPGEPTVADGRYKLRRPVLLLTNKQPDAVTAAFIAFALSPDGQKIVRGMFAPYTAPATVPKHAAFQPQGTSNQ